MKKFYLTNEDKKVLRIFKDFEEGCKYVDDRVANKGWSNKDGKWLIRDKKEDSYMVCYGSKYYSLNEYGI